GRAHEWFGARQDVGDLPGGIALRRGRRCRGAPLGGTGGDTGDLGGPHDQGSAFEPGGLLDGADRSAALIAVEVDPVAGVSTAERDDAGAYLSRRVALDVGEPPLVA